MQPLIARRFALAVAIVQIAIMLASALPRTASAFDAASPVGLWRSLDDKTGRPQALIRIELRDQKYFGRVEWTDTPSDVGKRCTVCTDERRNAPIIGLEIIRNLERTEAGFEHGDILDARSGSVYDCKVWLEEEGRVLVVRGYLGLPLLGGSRRWQRVS